MMGEKEFLTAVYGFSYFGPVRTKLLLSYFKNAKNICGASVSDLLSTGLTKDMVLKFDRYRKNFDIPKYFENLKRLGVKVATIYEDDYPENLKGIEDAPIVLYTKGEIKKSDSRSIAIVGTRMMTSYGREVAAKFASELSKCGFTIISGLALGVDAEAQKAAFNSGGRTIAVLASGLDTISPISNRSLALNFIRANGAVVSEYPIGHIIQRYDFPIRDRIISGLAKGVIVIEGKMKSGTFHTVRAALDQGRPVFAVPGQITSPASEATNYLIQNGAKLVTSVKDILEELD